jgi:hypothetical protein
MRKQNANQVIINSPEQNLGKHISHQIKLNCGKRVALLKPFTSHKIFTIDIIYLNTKGAFMQDHLNSVFPNNTKTPRFKHLIKEFLINLVVGFSWSSFKTRPGNFLE